MKITFYGHSTLALDLNHGRERLAIDPGGEEYSDADAALAGARHVLLTHKHIGHMNVPRLRDWLPRNVLADVWAPADAVAAITDRLEENAAARVHTAEPGAQIPMGGFAVTVGGGHDTAVHRDAPPGRNMTYLIRADAKVLYDPGDSFDLPDTTAQLDVLFTPIAGLWMRLAQAMDFTRGLEPWLVVPVHGTILSDMGLRQVDRYLGDVVAKMNPASTDRRNPLASTTRRHVYRRMKRGESIDV